MKTFNLNTILAVLAVLVMVTFSSCEKDEITPNNNLVEQEFYTSTIYYDGKFIDYINVKELTGVYKWDVFNDSIMINGVDLSKYYKDFEQGKWLKASEVTKIIDSRKNVIEFNSPVMKDENGALKSYKIRLSSVHFSTPK